MSLDPFLERCRKTPVEPYLDDRTLETRIVVDAQHTFRSSRIERLHDQRIADLTRESAGALGIGDAGRTGTGHARLTQLVLHRGLVPAQERGPLRGAGYAAARTHARSRQDVGLDGRFEPIDPTARLDATHRSFELGLVRDPLHAFVAGEPRSELGVERFERTLTDPGDPRSDRTQRPGVLSLGPRERGLDHQDVHALPPWSRPDQPISRRYSAT